MCTSSTEVSELTLATPPTGVRTLKTLSELRGEWRRQQEPQRNPHFSFFKGGQLCTSKTALLLFLSPQTCLLPPFKGRLSPGIRDNATGIRGGSAQQPGPLRLCQGFQREHDRLSSPSADCAVLWGGCLPLSGPQTLAGELLPTRIEVMESKSSPILTNTLAINFDFCLGPRLLGDGKQSPRGPATSF